MRPTTLLFALLWVGHCHAQSLDFQLQNAPNTAITLQHLSGVLLQDTTTWRATTDASGWASVTLSGLSANAGSAPATPLRVQLGDSLRFEVWQATDAPMRVQLDYLAPAATFQCQGATATQTTWLYHLTLHTAAPNVRQRYGIATDLAPHASPRWMDAPPREVSDTLFEAYARHRYLVALHAQSLHKALLQSPIPTDVIDDWSYLWRAEATSQPYYADFLQAYFLYRSYLQHSPHHAPTLPQCFALTDAFPEAQQGAFPRILLLWKALTPHPSDTTDSDALAYQYPTRAAFAERQLNLLAQQLPSDVLAALQMRVLQRPKFDPNGPAPDFTLTYPNGQTLSLTQLRGRVVFITFWASWSHKSLQEFARTSGIRAQLMDKGVAVLTLSYDADADDWQRALERYPTVGEHFRTHDQPQLRDCYQVKQFPAYYLINREGQLVPMPSGSVRFIDYVTGL